MSTDAIVPFDLSSSVDNGDSRVKSKRLQNKCNNSFLMLKLRLPSECK
jgi:hypothetical protein